MRRWGERAVAAGIVTISDIRSGDPAACTLLPGATSPGPIDEVPSRHSAPIADRRYTRQEDFERLMAEAIAMRRR